MRRVLTVIVLGACGDARPCDARATAAALAGPGAVDCGSPNPYRGRYSATAREVSVSCMADAIDAGVPFFGAWLDRCQLDTCAFEGRSYDGANLWVLQQWILDDLAETSTIVVRRCDPEIRERVVTTATGEVVRREVLCGDVTDVDELEDNECLEAEDLHGVD